MKKIILLSMLVLCLAQTAYAVLPVSQSNVQSAQMFGMGQKDVSTAKLLSGWTVYDSKKQNIYGNQEHIVIYTPYLATAVDAQTAAKRGESSTIQRGLDLAKEYDGILALGIVLNTTFKAEPKLIKIQLTADGKIYQPYYTSLEKATASMVNMPKAIVDGGKNSGGISVAEKEKLNQMQKEVAARNKAVLKGQKPGQGTVSNKPQGPEKVAVKIWHMEYFTYFDLSGISTNQPLILSIVDQVGGERKFTINLNNIK